MWEVKSVQLLICEVSELHLPQLSFSWFVYIDWIFWWEGRCLEICASLLCYILLGSDTASSCGVAEFAFHVIVFDIYTRYFQVCF